MKILIYKRTHVGDPNIKGEFGIEGCMGRVRRFAFDAVIGVGGISGQPTQQRLAGKINWVGRKPRRSPNLVDPRGPLISFDMKDFRLFEQNGPYLVTLAPRLAKKVYGSRARFVFTSLSLAERREARKVISQLLNSGSPDHIQLAKQVALKCNPSCGAKMLRKRVICWPHVRRVPPNKLFPRTASGCR